MSTPAADETSIAIIGMAGRFPGADDVREFWRNLYEGVESVSSFSDEQLRASGIAEEVFHEPNYVRARAVLAKPEWFDAGFFGFTPREAELTDPQQRVFLECAWTALEDAGLDPTRYAGTVGLFAGSSMNTYLLDNIGSHREQIAEFVTQFQTDGYPLLLGNDKDYLATRCAYKFNLRGPAVTVQTACSTSLVAVVQAVNALIGYQCDAALAGGVSISFPQERGHLYQEGAIASGNGHTRAFDADAQGTIFGSGCGVVVLKRLKDALADGDHIYATILAAAVNNDGSDKVSYVAPGVNGQAEVISLAHALANVSAETIDYVEAHGTATPLGDPIEVNALTQAFRATTEREGFCLLGTAKTNVGHLESAAGVTGLIKTALALEHGVIPPSLHFTAPNPRIDFANSPFRVVTERTEWKRRDHPRRAGVSSFGVGGTNAHVVLEEAPQTSSPHEGDASPQLIVLSARSLKALEDATSRLAEHLRNHSELSLADVSWTLQAGRRAFEYRRFVVATNAAEAARLLRRRDRRRVFTTRPASTPPADADELTKLGLRWLAGEEIDWAKRHNDVRRKVSLPTYAFQRERYWIEPLREAPKVATADAKREEPDAAPVDPLASLKAELTSLSGVDLGKAERETTLLHLGFDSLLLTQVAIALQKKFGVKLRFRQLLDELSTLGALANYCAAGTVAPKVSKAAERTSVPPLAVAKPVAFGPFRPLQKELAGRLTEHQQRWLEEFVSAYTRLTPSSKLHTAKHRAHFADPRAVAGFKDVWKEMVYPIVAARSAGAHLWDLDGNEYVDTTMGFGLALFGHQPDFVMEAIRRQMELGMEIGPTSPMAGEVAELLCKLTGLERATFCNTGSEAVLGAIRIARTATGRNKIALFAGAYHGINDEALVRPLVVNGEWRTVPIAPGIVQDAVANVLVLDYGNPESLDLIRRHSDELAAVLVEPVQSRRPDLQPREFLHELRVFTAERDIALIFDEVITGFRCHPGGAQAHFGIKADIATYGKVIGGGMPIGAIAGRAEYMDSFDGGTWNYGDSSYPTAGVTFFAGTFVRHPLALAAAKAVLERIDRAGPVLQEELAAKNARMISAINSSLADTPFDVPHFSSLSYVRADDFKFSGLLYALLRHRGIHIWEGRPCFISTAHSEADIAKIVGAFRDCANELRRGEFFSTQARSITSGATDLTPLTEAQREIWLAAQLGPSATVAFNETCTLEFFGPLDETKLKDAIIDVVQRHDALRATFAPDGSGQRFTDSFSLDLPIVNATAQELAAMRAEEGSRQFDLTAGPLVAFQLVRLAPEHHALLITAHHIACDGWSYDILLRELAALYRGEALQPAMQFAEYVKWEESQDSTAEAESAKRYWLGQFRELPEPLELPTDRSRPAQRSWSGARQELQLPADLRQTVSQYGAQQGATLFATLLAAFQTLLHRLSGSADLVIGIPAAGQNLTGGHDLIGHCANLLPLRQRVGDDQPFAALVAETKRTLLDAFEHQQFTYGRLLQRLNVRRDPTRPPLVSVIFNLDPPLSDLRFGTLKHSLSLNPRRHYQFDLGFNLVDEPEGLRVECDYNPELFDATTIQRWLSHYATLLASIAACGPPQLLTEAEREELIVSWNQTARPHPAEEPVTLAFERNAAARPDAIAVVENGTRITYGELNVLANRWAHDLIPHVKAGDLIGLPAVRGSRFVAAALGILKAGAAYVPLSPDDPPERRARLAADCRTVLEMDAEPQSNDTSNPVPRVGGGDAAYVLFTSGSTGTPKGVVVPHRAISRLVVNSDYVEFQPDEVVAMASNLCFDAATFEIWGALLNGCTLVVTPADALLTPAALAEHLEKHGITTLFLTTSLFHQMAQQAPPMFAGLRNLVFGGEAADAHCVRLVLENGRPGRLVNGYGPTETTTFAVCHVCETVGAKVPIGHPIANTTAFVLDERMEPVPIGVAGDLYIGGPGVALGYHRAPETTAERFLQTRYGRVYRTGDLARWLPDGTLDYIGRRDQQVKVRGFRVEPGEIEAALRTIPGIGDCAVVVRDAQLIAYFAPNGAEPPETPDLREHLARTLPGWMLPASFVRLSRLPLTANGKLDQRALPAPDFASVKRDGRPETTLHMQLIEFWESTLERRPIGVHDDFFELGGHSLLAAKMLAAVETRFGRRVPFSVLFERATIAHLSEHLVTEERRAATDEPLVTIQASGTKTPIFFLHGDFSGGGFYCRNLAAFIGSDRPFHALHPHGLHGETLPDSIEAMASDRLRAIRRVQPAGPYVLGGFCNGALIAYEIARQLETAGERVQAVVLIGADASNFKFRHLDGLARGIGRLLGEDASAQSERFRGWRRRFVEGQQQAREQVKRIRRLAEEPGELAAKLRRFVQRRLQSSNGSSAASAEKLGVAEAQPSVLDAYMGALEAYVPRPYAGRVIVIAAKDDPFTAGQSPTYGWDALCGRLEVIEVPGEHQSSVALDQNLRILAARLRQALEPGAASEAVSR